MSWMFMGWSSSRRCLHHQPSSILNSFQSVSFWMPLWYNPRLYSSLQVFGCACFVLFQPHEHSKLEPWCWLCYFLWYVIEDKGYRCWDLISQCLRITRHVVFWNTPHSLPSPSFRLVASFPFLLIHHFTCSLLIPLQIVMQFFLLLLLIL